MTSSELSDLEAKARAAWRCTCRLSIWGCICCEERCEPAANPETVLRLIAEVRRLRAA